jgi:hypothetical protein
MALYMVERDVTGTSPERLRFEQTGLASACIQLKLQGKRVRFISSAVIPADGRALDLFGADDTELVKEVHVVARVSYSRIVEILDLTPTFIHRDVSRPRRTLRKAVVKGAGGSPTDAAKGVTLTMATDSTSELTRWLGEGQRFLGVCLETVENADRLQARNHTLERENEMLREEVTRLRHRIDVLQTDRNDMVAAFNDLAGHVTQVVDHILQKSEDGENGRESG